MQSRAFRQCPVCRRGTGPSLRHRQHAQARPAPFNGLLGEKIDGLGIVGLAHAQNGLRCALDVHRLRPAHWIRPPMRHVGLALADARVWSGRPALQSELLTAGCLEDGLVHRFDAIRHTGQGRTLQRAVLRAAQARAGLHPMGSVAIVQAHQLHAIARQCAGLVHAQHRHRAERLDGLRLPGQDLVPGQAPGAQRQHDSPNHCKLFGNQGHGQGQARQKSRGPGSVADGVQGGRQKTGQQRDHGEALHDLPKFILQAAGAGRQPRE
jgi:hypothetical protein